MGMLDGILGRASRPQRALIITEDGRTDDEDLQVEKLYLLRAKTTEAWYLLHGLMLPYHDNEDDVGVNAQVLLLNERDAVPLDPFNLLTEAQKDELSSTKYIAEMTIADEGRRAIQKQWRDQIASGIRFVLTMFGIVFALAVIMAVTGRCGA